jgi:hypothetical protein
MKGISLKTQLPKRLWRYVGAAAIAGALLTVAGPGGTAWADGMPLPVVNTPQHSSSAAPHGSECESPCLVRVKMAQQGFMLPNSIHAGLITFRVSTTDPQGHTLQGFRLRGGTSLSEALSEFKMAVSQNPSTAAKGIGELNDDITAVGGAAVDPVTPVWATLPLSAGKYYFFDFATLFVPGAHVVFHTLWVHGNFEADPPAHQGTIVQEETKAGPRFAAPSWFNTDNTLLVVNRAPEIHEAAFQRVKPGVDNQDITNFFNAIAQGKTPNFVPFAEQGSRGMAALSPGRRAWLHMDPPAGKYVLACFVPDEKTGIPHAFEGMHRIIRLG